MRCPFCSEIDTRVIDSRVAGAGDQIRRRRECTACKERFTSYEVAELVLPHVVKSDGGREPFRQNKLREGILRAIEKRPVEMEKVEAVVAYVEKKLRAQGDREVQSRRLGDWVMEQLREIDQVAYVRFASVYKQFEDVQSFLEEVERLRNVLPADMRELQFDWLKTDGEED